MVALENAQERISKMIEAREQLSYKKKLKVLRLFCLDTNRLERDTTSVCIIW